MKKRERRLLYRKMEIQTDCYHGRQFGILIVLSSYRNKKGYWKCICQCKCGKQKEIFTSNLLKWWDKKLWLYKRKSESDWGYEFMSNPSWKLSKSNTSGVRGMSPTRNGKWIAKSHFRESDIFLEHMQQLMKQQKQETRRSEIF